MQRNMDAGPAIDNKYTVKTETVLRCPQSSCRRNSISTLALSSIKHLPLTDSYGRCFNDSLHRHNRAATIKRKDQ